MAEQYLVLLNDSLKRYVLSMDEAGKRRLQEKLEYLANGIWDAGVRVKKLKGAGSKVVFEARLSRAERILFTLGRHGNRIAAYLWDVVAHDDVGRRARVIAPENAPFLDFESVSEEELPETVFDKPVPEWLTQEDIEAKAGEGYGPQKWLVLDDAEWRRLLAGAEPDSLELYLFLTREQESVLRQDPPVLLSGTAGSGKTTILVYYLLRPEFRDKRRLFLTYSPFLQRFSQRIFLGLVKNTDLDTAAQEEAGARRDPPGQRSAGSSAPEFRVFRELVEEILAACGAGLDRRGEVRLSEFERIYRNHPLHRRYDAELVWEEIRSIIKGAKPPVDAQGCRRLVGEHLRGALGQAGLRRLQEYLLDLKPFEWIAKIERILERKTGFSSYDHFVQSIADPQYAVRGETQLLLKETARLVEEKARGFETPLLSLAEYRLLGKKRAPNFLFDREEIYSIAQYYQERLQAEGRWDEIDLCRRALAVLDVDDERLERFAYDLVVCDEVQDFADIQLSLVFRLARPFHRIAFAGDLKQIINPSGFRWEDVKQKFYERGREAPEVRMLNLNFRCVGSIVRLANALLDLKQSLVGLAGGEVREDWKFQGRPPFLLTGLQEQEVLERVRITAAGRIILVREAREQRRLKELLGSELVFTVHEAKGLEFDAVLLWRFGGDRKAQEIWRRILRGEPPEASHAPHVRHELNLLYVAVTRARNLLVLYDGPEPSRIWEAGALGELVHRTGEQEVLSGIWERLSTPGQWREQGGYFFDREHFAAAAECYRNAGDQDREEIAQAFFLRSRGSANEAAELFAVHGYSREAAQGFQQAGRFAEAARSWKAAGDQRQARICELRLLEEAHEYDQAAAGWEELGEAAEAARNWEKGRNHGKLADYLYAQKDYAEAAEHYAQAGDLRAAAQSFVRARSWSRAAELYRSAGAWSKAAVLYKKLGNRERLLEACEKSGDFQAAARLYEKAGELQKAIIALRSFAEADPAQRQSLQRQADSYRRATLKAAVRYSALGLYDRSAPLFQARGHADLARADYLAAGDPLAGARCLASAGRHLEAAAEMEGLEFPEKEQYVQAELTAHMRRRWGYDQDKAQELARDGDAYLRRGDPRRALRRFRALRYADGVMRALLALGDDAEALGLLVEEGELEEVERYVEERGEALQVSFGALEELAAVFTAPGSWQLADEELRLFAALLDRVPTREREAAQPLLRRLFALHQPHFTFEEEYPEDRLQLLLEARSYNAVYDLLRWHQFSRPGVPRFLPAFLDRLQSVGEQAGDKALLACAALLRDRDRFDELVAELPVDPWNYQLVGESRPHYRRAVDWLMGSPQEIEGGLPEATAICRHNGDYALAASLCQSRGDLAGAARHYRDGGLFAEALAGYREVADEPSQARMHERLGQWEEALSIWRRRGRERDVQRVLKRRSAPGAPGKGGAGGREPAQGELF